MAIFYDGTLAAGNYTLKSNTYAAGGYSANNSARDCRHLAKNLENAVILDV